MPKYKWIRVPEKVHAAIKAAAEKQGRTISSELKINYKVK